MKKDKYKKGLKIDSRSDLQQHLRKFVFFTLVLFIDFSTKYWVAHNLPMFQFYAGYPFGGIGIFQSSFLSFSIVHTVNTGTAWGLFADYQMILLILRIVITAGIIGYLLFYCPYRFMQMPLTLIAAGALGNILDFFLYGHVIDMVYLIFYHYSYPIFNVADAVIFCSVFYLFIYSFRKKGKGGRYAPPR